jgi:hypothetical protein
VIPSSSGRSDETSTIVVFFRGELRGEFAGAGMREEDIAHVAVAGAPLIPVAAEIGLETS